MIRHLKIVIPGEPAVKKNNMRAKFWTYVNGKQVPLKQPVWYYTKAYKEWAVKAVQHLALLKFNGYLPKELLDGQYFMTTIFYRSRPGTIDINNLTQGIQDLLAGNAGVHTIPKEKYAIIKDDSYKYIVPGVPIVLIEANAPRIEVYLSEFNFKRWASCYNIMHRSETNGLTVGKPESFRLKDMVQVIEE